MKTVDISLLTVSIESDPRFTEETKRLLSAALKNSTVTRALKKRFAKGSELRDIIDYGVNDATGMASFSLAFAPAGQIKLASDYFLVVSTPDSRVVSVIDPFQPPARTQGAMPFVLCRPSASELRSHNPEELEAADERAAAFMRKLFGNVLDVKPIRTTRYKTCLLKTGWEGVRCDGWWWDDGEDEHYPRPPSVS